MTKDWHKLYPVWEGPFDVVKVIRLGSYKLQWEDGYRFQIPRILISYDYFICK
jgi:hypothetical protein